LILKLINIIVDLSKRENMKTEIVAEMPDSESIKATIIALGSFAVVFIGLNHRFGNPITFASIANADPTALITNVMVFGLGAVTTYAVFSWFES
jgi:hypothetical protein